MATNPFSPRATYYEVLTAAIADLCEHGFDSEDRLAKWMQALRRAAERNYPDAQIDLDVRRSLAASFSRHVDSGKVLKSHPGVNKVTLDRIKPKLRAALDRRIMASSDLIKLNRVEAIEKTLRRFQGWASSVPPGGIRDAEKAKAKEGIRKSVRDLPFVQRRVLIDQNAKLVASISEVIAEQGGAIAVVWHSHWRQSGYDFREDHKDRDGKVYLLRDSWAHKAGIVKPGPDGYYDEIDPVASAVYCRCFATYIYAPRRLPEDMLTLKGMARAAA